MDKLSVKEFIVKKFNETGGRAVILLIKGDAMCRKLYDNNLPIDSVEVYISYKVYGKKLGDTVFRRILPISGILRWAEICLNE